MNKESNIKSGVTAEFEATLLQHITRDPSGLWQCTLCSLSSNKKSNVLCHVESKHIQMGGWQCHLCKEGLHKISTPPLYKTIDKEV